MSQAQLLAGPLFISYLRFKFSELDGTVLQVFQIYFWDGSYLFCAGCRDMG